MATRPALLLVTTALLLTGPEAGAGEFRVIGHRGAAGSAPENTLPSLERAQALGAREVEVDLQLSRDGKLILFHDDQLDRKTTLGGAVNEHDLAVLRTAEIGLWFDRSHPNVKRRYTGTRLATPEEAFDRFGDRFFWHLEIKSEEPELPAALLAAVRDAQLEHRVMVTSFQPQQLARARALAPSVPLCLLVHRRDPAKSRPALKAVLSDAAARGFEMVAIAAPELTPKEIRHARELGLEIRAFGVEDDRQLEHVIELGADGATVDHPDRAFAILRRHALGTR